MILLSIQVLDINQLFDFSAWIQFILLHTQREYHKLTNE